MVIPDLQAETTYSVTVAAYTTKGDGARSKPKLITTTGAGRTTPTQEHPSPFKGANSVRPLFLLRLSSR